MKAIIRLNDLSKSGTVIKALADAIDSGVSLRKSIVDNGVLFAESQPTVVKTLTDQLEQQQYSTYQTMPDSVRIDANSDSTDDLFRTVVPVLAEATALAKALWASGMTLEVETEDQAQYVKEYFEAEGAEVTLVEQSYDEYTVSGQVRHTDNTLFSDGGYTLQTQAFDKLVATNNNVSLGAPALQQADESYHIAFIGESAGNQNCPNLLAPNQPTECKSIAKGKIPFAKGKGTLSQEFKTMHSTHKFLQHWHETPALTFALPPKPKHPV